MDTRRLQKTRGIKMVRLKRLKNKEDLLDVLNYVYEDICTYKLANDDIKHRMSEIIEMVS